MSMPPPIERVPPTPGAPVHRVIRSSKGAHVLVVPHSRLLDVDAAFAEALDRNDSSALQAIVELTAPAWGEAPLDLVPDIAPHAISLNVSSSCNLSCGYCYASRGSFGDNSRQAMSIAVALASVDTLLAGAERGAPVTIGFLGGEPFVRPDVIHAVVEHASARGRREGIDVRFSVTTNGTLLRPADHELLRAHPFAVTVSIDGGRDVQDTQRPLRLGGRRAVSSFDALRAATGPLLESPGLARLAARATVSRSRLDIGTAFDAIVALGFTEVGFSPLRASPETSDDVFRDQDWPIYLDASMALARRELDRVQSANGLEKAIRFSNLAIALRQLASGSSMPYPCGAGGGYASIAPEGDWYACHRAIGKPDYKLGGPEGPSRDASRRFLAARHVHAKAPCGGCWARYLCSGACHQEALSLSEASCSFIRDWLQFCLTIYCESDAMGGLVSSDRGLEHG